LFVYILGCLTVMLLQVVAPQDTEATLVSLIVEKVSSAGSLSLGLLGTVLWFAVLGLAIRYFQTLIHIERQYSYIHAIETHLAADYPDPVFTREGKDYRRDYPLFSSWASVLYSVLFPLVFLAVLVVKLCAECRGTQENRALLWVDVVVFVAIAGSVALYMLSLHKSKKPEAGQPVPGREPKDQE
jgi:hypothetical protein